MSSNEVTAIKKELSRVRQLKRSAEAEVELLRSDMERGVIHLRIPNDPEFRQELSEKMVAINHPGWVKQYNGWYMVDLTTSTIYHRETYGTYAQSNEGLIPIEQCFDDNNGRNDFSCENDEDYEIQIEFALSCIRDEVLVKI